MLFALLTLLFLFFQFDPVTFAQAAVPIAVAVVAFAASFGLDLHASRVRSAVGLLASVYAAAAPYIGLMQNGPARVGMFIAGILVVALNERIQGGASKALVFILIGALSLGSVACFGGGKAPTKEEFVADAREVIGGMRDALPVLQGAGVNTRNLEKGINTGDTLISAFENNDTSNALLLVADLISAFEASEADAQLIPDSRKKIFVLAGLALTKIALRRLASRVDSAVVAADVAGVKVSGVTSFDDNKQKSKAQEAKRKIKAFIKKKQSRCKNAKSGRFEKMEFCRQFPDLSYVITY